MIEGVSPELRAALVSSAKDQDISINEVAVRVLADHYKVKVTTPENGLRGQREKATHSFERAETDKLSIRGPASLHRKLSEDAKRRGGTLRGVILERLSLNFGLSPEPITKRPRTQKEQKQ